MINKARQAVSILEMSAVKDDNMSVDRAEELREVVYHALDHTNELKKELKKTKKEFKEFAKGADEIERMFYENLTKNKKLEEENQRYKAIEKELGIDLMTKHKVEESNEVYVEGLGIVEVMNYYRTGISLDKYDASGNQMFLRYKDYGITWALTKEELE